MALATGTPFIFPSLGPTAFLFFFNPRAPSASPHHTLIGHAIGIACGYSSLVLLGLQHSGSALALGVTGPRVLAAALSLAATGALMILFKAAHPPAGRHDAHHLARRHRPAPAPGRRRGGARAPRPAGHRHQSSGRPRLPALAAARGGAHPHLNIDHRAARRGPEGAGDLRP